MAVIYLPSRGAAAGGGGGRERRRRGRDAEEVEEGGGGEGKHDLAPMISIGAHAKVAPNQAVLIHMGPGGLAGCVGNMNLAVERDIIQVLS